MAVTNSIVKLEPLQFPPDTVLLRSAREHYAREIERMHAENATNTLRELHLRIRNVDLGSSNAELYGQVQAIVSGAVLLREHVKFRMQATQTIAAFADGKGGA